MQAFERAMTLDDKKARYYDLSPLADSDTNVQLSPAHFYGGNGFTAGIYLPLLTKLSESIYYHQSRHAWLLVRSTIRQKADSRARC